MIMNGGKPQESEAFFTLLTDTVEKPVDRAGPETNYVNCHRNEGTIDAFLCGHLKQLILQTFDAWQFREKRPSASCVINMS
jgi:hypothetical protein